MTTKQKLYIAAAALVVLLAGLLIGSVRSHLELRRLNREVDAAERTAAARQAEAAQAQQQAGQFRSRSEYLEGQLNQLRQQAAQQDETLNTLNSNTDHARRTVDLTRRTSASPNTNAADLCRKLAELGHPCE